MKNKKIILFFLLVSLVTKAEEYNENTMTKNNWKTIETNKSSNIEKSENKVKFNYSYLDGDVIGTKSKNIPNANTVDNIIESKNIHGGELVKPITETTISSDGTLHLIHVDDDKPIDWQVGVHVYNSNSNMVDRSETILNFNTNTDFNIKTHKKYTGRYYPIYNIVDTVGQGNSSNVTKPVSTINFLKKVNMKNEIQTVNPGSLKSNGGGETHVTFNDDATMNTKSTTDNLSIATFRLENNGENRYRTVSTKNDIDVEQGGSTVTFDGNVESSISGNTNTGMQFLANTNYHGGLHVEAKEGKNFQSTIINESTSNTNNILNLNTDTRNHGLSVFIFKSNTDLVTKASSGIAWGIYMNGDSHGENRVTISGSKNSIYTIGNDYVYGIDISASINDENGADYAKVGQGKNLLDLDNSNVTTESTSTDKPWVYGIKSSAVDGENTVRLHNSNIKTGSNFVARSMDIRDENLGKNNFELENTSIETEGQYSYGINLQSNSESDGKGENSINFKGNNNIYSKALSNAYGIRIEKDRANIGKGTTITSDKDSNVNIKIETENSGYGISQIHTKSTNKTETTFNGDVSITMNGNGNKKIAVYNVAPENVTDDSKSTITFNKKLNIVGASTDPALVSSGKNAEITVAGKDNVNILGNIFTSNEGKVSLNLLNENSHLIGLANNNSTGIIDTKLANSSHWLMTADSKINTLDISSEGTIDFLDAESPVTLSVDNLKGNGGIFKMQGNVQTGETDLLSIKNSSKGNHYIEFENMAGAKSSGTEVLKLVESLGNEVDNNATFKLKNPNDRVDIPEDNSKPTNPGALIERGAYLYALGRATDSKVVDTGDKNKNNWYLYPYKEEEKIKPVEPLKIIDDKPGKLTPGAETSLIFNDLIYQLNLVSIETLVQRLGEVHFDKNIIKNNNVWIKHINGKYSGENLRTGKYRHRYWGIEVGYDWVKAREKWINYNGLLFGHIESSAKFGSYPGKSKIAGEELGLYSTWLNKENNVYYDFVAKATRYKGQYDIENYSKQKVSSNKARIKSYLLSVEAGKRIFLNQSEKKEYYIQPEAQLKYQFTNGYNLNLSNGLQVRTEDLDSLIGRIGFRAGLDSFANESINPYIKLMYEKEFLGKVRHHFNESGMEEVRNKDHWFTYGLGLTNINKEKGRQIYLEIQKSSKHRIKQKWQINLGMRYTL